ncbi:MAG: GTP cyclohydrolase II [Rhodospirillales bacterium]
MTKPSAPSAAALRLPRPAGAPARARLVAVDRALAELRRGDPVLIEGAAGTPLAALTVETAAPEALARLAALASAPAALAVTVARARALGLSLGSADGCGLLELPAGVPETTLRALVDPTQGPPPRPLPVTRRAGEEAAAAVELARLAGLLPAALVAPATDADAARNAGVLSVPASAVWQYRDLGAAGIAPVGEALVPLDAGGGAAVTARVVAFRPADGAAEHLAIVIGAPDADAPVLVRLHSQCATGDLLGSLRCDCGDQLRGAIREIAAAGAGALIYLAQEGRGIGLVNKLRAYWLQDRGFDTVEANEQLGFHADERGYREAAEMLRQLGFIRVRLMTNNPRKLRALADHGIEVAERVPHAFPANGHNERYLWTKAQRSGHLF